MRVRELTLMVGTGRIEEMTRFYGAALELERVAKFRDPVFEAAGGFIRLLDHSEISGPTLEPARMQINLFVDDVAAEFERVMSADPTIRVHRSTRAGSRGSSAGGSTCSKRCPARAFPDASIPSAGVRRACGRIPRMEFISERQRALVDIRPRWAYPTVETANLRRLSAYRGRVVQSLPCMRV